MIETTRKRMRRLLASAVSVPGMSTAGVRGVAVPGEPSVGIPGLSTPGASSPYIPAAAGGVTAGALRLGPENSTYMFSAASVGGQYLAAASGALGAPNYYRAVNVPLPNMPTSGDCWTGIFFRTPSFATSQGLVNNLLGVQGASNTSTTGGAVCWADAGLQATGSSTNGSEIAPTAGFIQVQRSAASNSFHLWGTTSSLTTTTLGPVQVDRDYLLIVGISGTFGAMILVDILAAQQGSPTAATLLTSATAVTGRASGGVPMFNLVGATGAALSTVAASGFGGSVSDIHYAVSTFPTTAQAQAIALGQTAIGAIPGIAYWNTLDVSQASGGAIVPQIGTGNATITGANVLAAAPIRKPSALSINRLGSHWVFPIACGETAGSAWIEGTAPAGAVVNCQLLYVDGTTSETVQATADGTGSFAAAIQSPPTGDTGSKPFYRKVWPANGDVSNTVVDFDVMDVGIVVHVFGQSECERLTNMGATMSASPPTPGTSGNAGYNLPMPGSYAGPWASYLDMVNHSTTGYATVKYSWAMPRPEIMLGNGYPADGTVAAATAVVATGFSTMFVYTCRSGHPEDAYILDGQTFTKTLTLTGAGTSASPYLGTILLQTADVTAKFGYPGQILTSSYQQQVQPASVSITFANGVNPVTVTDAAGFSGYAPALGSSAYPVTTLAGPNGASGTVTCSGGAVSVQFSGTVPTGPATVTWTVKQETGDGGYLPKTQFINGFGVKEALNRIGSLGLRYGSTVNWCFWVTNIEGEGGSVAAMTPDLFAKLTLIRALAYGGTSFWPGFLGSGLSLAAGVASPPMVVAPKSRETSSGFVNVYSSLDTTRQAQINLWPNGSDPLAFSLPGCWNYDIQVELATSPHEDSSAMGAQRIGRRFGCDVVAAFNQSATTNDAATWGNAVFGGYNGTAYTTITIELSAAWKAAHPTLQLTVNPNDGSSAAALGEWYFGGTTTTSGTLIDNATNATAAIGGDGTSVVITAIGGTTFTTGMLVRYIMGAPGKLTTIGGTGQFQNSNPVPQGLLYDNRGGFPAGTEPGLLVAPKFN